MKFTEEQAQPKTNGSYFGANHNQSDIMTAQNQPQKPDIKYLILSKGDLRQIDLGNFTIKQLKMRHYQWKDGVTIQMMLDNILKTLGKNAQAQLRAWLISNQNIQEFYQYLVKKTYSSVSYNIEGIGRLIQNKTEFLHNLRILPTNFFVIQCKNTINGQWFLKQGAYGRCARCKRQADLYIQCNCGNANYCSQKCENQLKQAHNKKCEYFQLQKKRMQFQKYNKFEARSNFGVVGLVNIRNSCYMNCILQCLSHIPVLTSYFLQGSHITEINLNNKLGIKGKLAQAYGWLMLDMWVGKQKKIRPYKLKKSISQFNDFFAGNQQHDCHQFFSFLIDGLHQDLNRVKNKFNYSEPKISKIQSDKELALQSWISYSKRNQSIIANLMTGQYKSRISCPTCQKELIQFDPFFTVTLPIFKKKVWMQFYTIYAAMRKPTVLSWFQDINGNAQQWICLAAEKMNLPRNRVQMYILTKREGIYKVNAQKMQKVRSKLLCQKPLFLLQIHQDDIDYDIQIAVVTIPSWLKFPIFCKKSNLTGKQVARKVFLMFYGQAYRYKDMGFCVQDLSQKEYLKRVFTSQKFYISLLHQRKIITNHIQPYYQYNKIIPIDLNTDIWKIITDNNLTDYELRVRIMTAGDFKIKKLSAFISPQSLPSPQPVTLQQCLKSFSTPETLEVGNQWYCSNCQQHRLAQKQISIYKAPDILVLHLRRFTMKGQTKLKNQTKVFFPQKINMKQYLVDWSPMRTYQPILQDLQILQQSSATTSLSNEQPIYQLLSCTNHYGNLTRGHYTAFVKENSKWYQFNDQEIKQVQTFQKVCTANAYMLFYKRIQKI